jgi:FtsP/CotA-like multicopper oxidase with cupredoxin domain
MNMGIPAGIGLLKKIRRPRRLKIFATRHGASAGRCFTGFLLAILSWTIFPIAQSKVQAAPPPGSTIHTYFIAADEVQWNYAPRGRNLAGLPGGETGGTANVIYKKAIYREYLDATFTTLKPRPPQWEHLGILGPLLRAEVGDTIKVVFKNNLKIFCSMHPHGLLYDKNSEGAVYNDGLSPEEKKGDKVSPGQTYTYTWYVPERAGPGPMDGSSILWVYHSHFVEPRDLNTGLMGPILITAKGMSKPDGTPKDVDREFVVAFSIFDETASWYFEANNMGRRPYQTNVNVTDPAFRQQYLLYSMNGFIDANLPGLTMKKGERVRWYLFANDNEEDVHTPHWHGQTVLFNHMRMDMLNLAPMMMVSADMVPDNLGTWLFHCHVNEHLENGMNALFTVTP